MRQTTKDKLIMFLELKNKRIKKFSRYNYIENEDIEDIKNWDLKICDMVYNKIANNILNHNYIYGLSNTTCPWCILYFYSMSNTCDLDSCGYAKRHGDCICTDSLYNKVCKECSDNHISNKEYVNMINKIENYFYKSKGVKS